MSYLPSTNEEKIEKKKNSLLRVLDKIAKNVCAITKVRQSSGSHDCHNIVGFMQQVRQEHEETQ